jgi:hypothetical protein
MRWIFLIAAVASLSCVGRIVVQGTHIAQCTARIIHDGGQVVYDYQLEWHSDNWEEWALTENIAKERLWMDYLSSVRVIILSKTELEKRDIECLQRLSGTLKAVDFRRGTSDDEYDKVQEALPNCVVRR